MTVTGLTTVNMSSLTPWQQTILFLQMCLGSPVSSISTSMAEQSTEIFQGSYILGNGFHPQVSQTLFLQLRHFIDLNLRYFFAKTFQHVLEAASPKKAAGLSIQPAENHTKSWLKRLIAFVTGHPMVVVDVGAAVDKEGRKKQKLTPDMIQRMDEPPKPINPSGSTSGWVSERHPSHNTIPPRSGKSFTSTPEFFEEFPSNSQACRPASSDKNCRRLSDPSPISRMLYSIKLVNTILMSLQFAHTNLQQKQKLLLWVI